MCVTLGVGPAELLECDAEIFEHLVTIAQRRRKEQLWAIEMSAATGELIHAVWRVLVQANSKRGATKPKPVRIPRPWDEEAPAPKPRVSFGQLARALRARRQ